MAKKKTLGQELIKGLQESIAYEKGNLKLRSTRASLKKSKSQKQTKAKKL